MQLIVKNREDAHARASPLKSVSGSILLLPASKVEMRVKRQFFDRWVKTLECEWHPSDVDELALLFSIGNSYLS